jgi:hypothetical protein
VTLLPANVPQSALDDLTHLYVQADIRHEQALAELTIRVANSDLSVRGFASYLSLADRIYGRLTEIGLKSYSQMRSSQLRISEIRQGSIELVISQALTHIGDATPLVTLWLFLKFLPVIIKSSSEAAKNYADAFKSYQEARLASETQRLLTNKTTSEITKNYADSFKSLEEGKLTRANRKQLRMQMKQDKALQQLNDRRLTQLVNLLQNLYSREYRAIPAAGRFAEKEIEAVIIEIRNRKNE